MEQPAQETPPRPHPADAFGLWLILATASAAGMAVFCAARTKPLIVFAAGLGLAVGLFLRMLAESLKVPRTRRVVGSVICLAAAALVLTFSLGYRRAALEWQQLHAQNRPDPLAAALLKSFPNSDPATLIAAQQRFTPSDYLARRLPNWPSPWPELLCSAECLLCCWIAGKCVGTTRRDHLEQPAATEPIPSATDSH